ncbi:MULTISPECIES: hypothetical protein [unclassified Bradyrhizobium]|uniref:hypothetical protein n=1 Tax=unclassified Bradyrhizobium TaxID=2631580 RepID=UPI001BA4B2EF|nr:MULTISPECIES: hypothetical protein [unclassified Bradyrhizobium]MBR1204471.1 hypothetical protein [Bradyrhizobium sp. AUGA SZCCT0124]MBR1309643.1 hypothetical protein [Bradyrhizobium sp. AUGA SZCCT0051]MBR1339784.1 hypothetical protein [Bradyrhizobium sp. AUGA SZCCT0105]MBR1354391.1 hypothetical protein [Bradyrhizobium sp. AUGA SZCCT0045]
MNVSIQPGRSGAEPCSFEAGAYARTTDGVVSIIGGGEDGYMVARITRAEEAFYRADELSRWAPQFGEGVVEAGNDECVTGVVVEAGDKTSLVKWPGFVRPQTWLNSDLEPAWTN